MASLRNPVCERLTFVMMNSFEFLTLEETLDIVANDQELLAELRKSSQLDRMAVLQAHLARASAYVLGELIANEWETPDSCRLPGHTREQAIADWHEAYALRNVAAERVAPRNCDC